MKATRMASAWFLMAAMAALAPATARAAAAAVPWRFGVMADTQWTCGTDPSGQNLNAVSVEIINQINPQFIAAGVKFVIQVGDLTQHGSNIEIQARAKAAQSLLDAGIGFFPMRGNHETYAMPTNSNGYGIPQFRESFPQTRGLTNTFGASHFNSPAADNNNLDGLSYAFDYGADSNNARFVVIDNWVTPDRQATFGDIIHYGCTFGDQQAWIGEQLDQTTRGTTHAFVLSHQPLMAENHQDTPFGGNAATNPAMQNAFIASLQCNNVRYYICGHDHIHQRSLIASPDGHSCVEEIIGVSDSSKFYTPKRIDDPGWAGQKTREVPLSQEMKTVGYYIYTVDGPRLTVDYYSDDHGGWGSDKDYPVAATGGAFTNLATPAFRFVKKETFGYSLNGQAFLVGQGESYTAVADRAPHGEAYGESYKGTTARILAGVNGSTNRDYNGRPLVREIDTGWAPSLQTSDVLTLWGLSDLGANRTDTYVLSMSYDPAATSMPAIQAGTFGLVARATRDGNWVNAVDLNAGGSPSFVLDAWNQKYALGTCGVDTNTSTAWAVVNHAGDFAVGSFPHTAK